LSPRRRVYQEAELTLLTGLHEGRGCCGRCEELYFKDQMNAYDSFTTERQKQVREVVTCS